MATLTDCHSEINIKRVWRSKSGKLSGLARWRWTLVFCEWAAIV